MYSLDLLYTPTVLSNAWYLVENNIYKHIILSLKLAVLYKNPCTYATYTNLHIRDSPARFRDEIGPITLLTLNSRLDRTLSKPLKAI